MLRMGGGGLMKSRDDLPDYLHTTYDMLKCAFPDGIPEEEYWSVMALIHPYASFRGTADILSSVTDKDHSEVYNDASGFGNPYDPMPDPANVEKVKQKLDACGYAAWIEKD
jgi:hypothetical protein